MPFLIGFLVLFGLMVVYLAVQAKKAGPRQLDEIALRRGVVIRSATAAEPGEGWSRLGSKTTADGLRLRFDHDDDPQAQASFVVDGSGEKPGNTLAHSLTVRLGSDFETHHVHTRGYVFRVRMRGTEPVIGKEVRIQMHVRSDGSPFCGQIENDDDTDAAVGGWIDFDSLEVLQVGPSA